MGRNRDKGHPTRTGLHLDRRRFGQLASALCALGMVEPHAVARALGPDRKRLSWRAYRNAEAEGHWLLRDVEGEVPTDLDGTLYRVAPGQSDNHGTPLRHFFDGDAFVSAFSFDEGRVSLKARYLDTPGRREELAAGRMLYTEFGTQPPPPPEPVGGEDGEAPPSGGKNQPNVNIIHWDGRLLALSEGGHPIAVDPVALTVQEEWDFHGSLPPFVPFTAHPKFDPATGEAFAYGVTQGPGMALNVFRMEPDGKLHQLHSVPQDAYYMIHDMILTTNHIVFVIPPVHFDLAALFRGEVPPAGALRYAETSPLRILILRRDGSGSPVVAEQPANMVFHNGNAFERDGRIVLDTILSPNDDVLKVLWSFSRDDLVIPDGLPRLTRLVVDPRTGEVTSRTELENDQEFPRFDPRKTGRDARHLLSVEGGIHEDPLVTTRLVRHDLHQGTARRIEAGSQRAFGEAVPVVTSGSGVTGESDLPNWILQQGYDSGRDETFLEVRHFDTLDLAARVWTGYHFPLGFHGNFVDGLRVPPPAVG